jgi:hypothetical protein
MQSKDNQTTLAALYWPIERWPRWQQLRYQEGRAAFGNGLDLDDNPHAPQSENAFVWDFGWAEADAGR